MKGDQYHPGMAKSIKEAQDAAAAAAKASEDMILVGIAALFKAGMLANPESNETKPLDNIAIIQAKSFLNACKYHGIWPGEPTK